jgi:hypothetical protein
MKRDFDLNEEEVEQQQRMLQDGEYDLEEEHENMGIAHPDSRTA